MIIAIDIGGTKTLVALYSNDGKIICKEKHKTEKDFNDFITQLPIEINKLCQGETIDGIGIAAPALIDFKTGIAKSFGNLSWENVDIIPPLKQQFTDLITIDNDANMGALGEANMGAGKGYERCLYVTLSTGIGTGITQNGKLDQGLRASEGGMMQFRHDGELKKWESFASGKAFVEEFGQRGEDDNNSEDWKQWAEDVSIGLVNLTSIIQPDVIIIGGSMGNYIDKYHGFLQTSVESKRGATVEMPMLVGAKYPDDAVINGCFVACKQSNQG